MILCVLSWFSFTFWYKDSVNLLSDPQVSTPVLRTNQSTLHIVARTDLSLKYSLSAKVEIEDQERSVRFSVCLIFLFFYFNKCLSFAWLRHKDRDFLQIVMIWEFFCDKWKRYVSFEAHRFAFNLKSLVVYAAFPAYTPIGHTFPLCTTYNCKACRWKCSFTVSNILSAPPKRRLSGDDRSNRLLPLAPS